jgi:1,4-alpha-glucan branching enzyme
MTSQQNITANTPMGANLVPSGGATFRVWAPRATAVYLNGVFGGIKLDGHSDEAQLLAKTGGYWTGFVVSAQEGDLYKFWVDGAGTSGFKRDPYARELASDAEFPHCSSIIRFPPAYPWHDSAFVAPGFSDMIVYQLHIGTYALETPGNSSTFLDVVGKISYLTDLGINVLQPLPVDEVEVDPSLGYNGADLFPPDFPTSLPKKLRSKLISSRSIKCSPRRDAPNYSCPIFVPDMPSSKCSSISLICLV